METYAALASVLLALTAAPLVLGSGPVVGQAGRRMRRPWLGLIAVLLVTSSAAGVIAVALVVVR